MHFSRVIGGLALWGVIGSVMANLTYETMRNLTAATDESRERILGVGEAWGAEVLGEGKQVVVGGGERDEVEDVSFVFPFYVVPWGYFPVFFCLKYKNTDAIGTLFGCTSSL